jgi:hypothetical protein
MGPGAQAPGEGWGAGGVRVNKIKPDSEELKERLRG